MLSFSGGGALTLRDALGVAIRLDIILSFLISVPKNVSDADSSDLLHLFSAAWIAQAEQDSEEDSSWGGWGWGLPAPRFTPTVTDTANFNG